MLKKNDILTVKVTDINHEGLGVAKQDGAVIFIKGAVTGDELEIKIIKEAKSYYVARVESIISPSPHRTEPVCIHSKRCGGCVYQHISEEYEKTLKENRLKNEFSRFGVRCNDIRPLVTDKHFGYRNKLQCPVSEQGEVGFYAKKSHEIIPVTSCVLQEEATKPIYKYLFERLSSHPEPEIRHIYLRIGVNTGEVMVCLVCYKEHFAGRDELVRDIAEKFPEVRSVILNVNPDDTNVVLGKKCITLYGKDYIEDILCGLRFKISPLSFYQVNHGCTELLYRAAAELAQVTTEDTLCDLYCGIGTIGLCINSIAPAKRLIGVEIVPEAIENAKENAKINGVTNAEFYCSPSEKFDFGNPDILIVDPPRKGLAPSLIEAIGKAGPKRIVYISCSPDTLARDCAMLQNEGYEVTSAEPFNMFPRTEHVETVVLLSREKAADYVRISVHTKDLKTIMT